MNTSTSQPAELIPTLTDVVVEDGDKSTTVNTKPLSRNSKLQRAHVHARLLKNQRAIERKIYKILQAKLKAANQEITTTIMAELEQALVDIEVTKQAAKKTE